MKLRVVSDGTLCGTMVLDEEGRELDDVLAVTWRVAVGERDGLARVVVELDATEVEALGDGVAVGELVVDDEAVDLEVLPRR